MFLYLNTTDHNFIHLALVKPSGQILVTKKIPAAYQQSEKLLTNTNTLMSSRRPARHASQGGAGGKLGSRKVINQKSCFLDSSFRWNDKNSHNFLQGIIVVSGPGGFSSLRIGLSTANALAWSLQIPIVGVRLPQFIPSEFRRNEPRDSTCLQNKQFIKQCLIKIKKIKKFQPVMPFYGAEPHITLKKK